MNRREFMGAAALFPVLRWPGRIPPLAVRAGKADYLVLPASGLTFGRGRGSQVYIGTPHTGRKISRKHFRVEITGKGAQLIDHESMYGTTLNGQPVYGPTPLRGGEMLRIAQALTFDTHLIRARSGRVGAVLLTRPGGTGFVVMNEEASLGGGPLRLFQGRGMRLDFAGDGYALVYEGGPALRSGQDTLESGQSIRLGRRTQVSYGRMKLNFEAHGLRQLVEPIDALKTQG